MFRQLLEYIVNSSDIDYTQYLVFTKTGTGVCKVKSASGVTIPKVIIPSTVDLNGETLTVNEIEAEGFKNFTNYNTIIIPDTITTIGNSAFYGCSSLKSFVMPNSVSSIGTALFRDCTSMQTLVISTSLTNLPNDFCRNCDALTVMDLSYTNLVTISARIFYGCDNITSVTFPEGMISNGSDCFYNNKKLTSINLPSTFETVGNYILQGTNVTHFVLPASIKKFNGSAFYDVTKLTDLYYKGTIANWCSINFSTDDSYCSPTRMTSPNFYILDPNGDVTYEGNTYTKVLNLVIPEGVTSIPYNSFRGCKFTSITIPSTLTSVGNYAFYNCNSVTVTYYNGTQAQWNNISVGSNNTKLTANIVYLQ